MQDNISDYIKMENRPDMPPTQIVWAILTTVFCCLPLGLVSMVKAVQVSSRYTKGDYEGAVAASKSAKAWAWAAAIVGFICAAVFAYLLFNGVIAGLETLKNAKPTLQF